MQERFRPLDLMYGGSFSKTHPAILAGGCRPVVWHDDLGLLDRAVPSQAQPILPVRVMVRAMDPLDPLSPQL
jgi:hypothetical protein